MSWSHVIAAYLGGVAATLCGYWAERIAIGPVEVLGVALWPLIVPLRALGFFMTEEEAREWMDENGDSEERRGGSR